MPHDKHGQEVKIGDLVTITARVTERHETENYCNLMLETLEIMPRSDEGLGPGQRTMITLNAKQVELKEARNLTFRAKAELPLPTTCRHGVSTDHHCNACSDAKRLRQ